MTEQIFCVHAITLGGGVSSVLSILYRRGREEGENANVVIFIGALVSGAKNIFQYFLIFYPRRTSYEFSLAIYHKPLCHCNVRMQECCVIN